MKKTITRPVPMKKNVPGAPGQATKPSFAVRSRLLLTGLMLSVGTLAYADFTPIPLNPSSFNKDPVIEASAPPSLNDFANVTPDAGTNKTGNTWYEMGYNTNTYATPTYSGPLTGLPHPGATFNTISNTAGSTSHSFQMPPTYAGNCVIFVGHNNNQWTPILGPGAFAVTAPAAYDHLSILSGTGNGPNNIQANVMHLDGTSEQIIFGSPDWFSAPNNGNLPGLNAAAAWRAGGLVNMQGGVNNQNGNPGTLWLTDLALGNTTSPVTNVVFTWFKGSSNGDSPWGNGRTLIFAMSGSIDGGATYSPITVTGYDHDGVFEASAPATAGAGSAALTGVLTNGGTYCNFTMDTGIWGVNWTWYEKGYYAAYPNSGLPTAGSTITSATKPSIHYTMPSTYVGNSAVCLSSNILSATINFASPTPAGSLSFLCGGGNGGFNLRVEIGYQGGGFETNWITVPDWFNRTGPWAYATFGQTRPEMRSIRNTPDQLQNNWIPVQPFGGVPPGQPFSRDPRNGGASFPDLPVPRLFDAVMPITNSAGAISSINLVVTNVGAFGNSASIFAVSGSPGTPPVITTQPFGFVTDSATGATNAITGSATANNIIITKGWQGTNNISLIVSNSTPGVSYQWKKAPRGGGWRDSFLTDYDMSTFANVTAPNVGGAQSSVMTISNVTLADSADYLVVLSNAYGMQTSFVATVMAVTTNSSILVGAGSGDSISLYTSDGTTGGSETVLSAGDQAAQKWLSTGVGSVGFDGGAVPKATIPYVGPAGYVVIPVNGSSVVKSIQFFCANDGQGRDPRDFSLEGSSDGASWAPIASGQLLGTLMLPAARGGTGSTPLNPLAQPLTEVDFANATAYKQYRVTITNCMEPVATPLMQVAEIRLMGTLVPNPPVWVRQPEPAVQVFVGTKPTWGVLAGGYPAPKFQWYRGATAIPNATNSTYTLTNAQLADSGAQFTVVAFNNAGSITSSPASTLTVIAAPTQSYPSSVLASGPVAYWRLDEKPDDGFGNNGVVTHDYAGGFNGYYSNAVINVPGYNPASDTNTAASFGAAGLDSLVTGINNLSFARNTNTAGATFSIEAWVLGGNQSVDAAILAKGYNGGLLAGTQTGTEQFVLDVTGGNPRKFRFMVRDFLGNGHPAQSSVLPYDPLTAQPTWRHLVGVCDQPNGNIYLYVDGVLAASGTISSNAGILNQSLPMTIGSRQSGGATEYDNQWNGTIDDVSVYPFALSASQVLAHFYAAQRPPLITLQPTNTTSADNVPVTFYSSAYGPGTLSYQWYLSDGTSPTTAVAGQTSSNLTFTTTPAQNNNYYQLVVTNNYGAVTSLVAQLTVDSGPPVFITDLPSGNTVSIGHLIQLHVVAGGTAPFTYQWQKNGVNLVNNYRTLGAQSDTLTIAYAAGADSGNYQVFVTDGAGGPVGSTVDAVTVVSNSGAFFGATSNSAAWSLQGTPGPAVLSGNTLQLSANAGSTARSAFLVAKQDITSFAAQFIYQDVTGAGGADGVTFCIQNQAVNALGGGGGSMGYSGITPSVALTLNIYAAQTRGINFFQNGTIAPPFFPILPVDLGNNTDKIQVDVAYSGTVLTAKFTDLTTLATYTTNLTVNIPSIVGANTAWVGFTGADGGVASTQVVSWGLPVATPFKLTTTQVGNNLVLSWPAAAGAYLQSTPSLSSPVVWSNDTTDQFALVGGQAQVTVTPSGASQFFRLQLYP